MNPRTPLTEEQKEHRRKSKREWRLKRKELGLPSDGTSKEKMIEWRENNSNRIKEYSKEYYNKNVEAIKPKKKRYRKENIDSIRDYNRQWAKDNPEKVTELSARRRARKRNATPKWLTDEDFDKMRDIYKESQRLTKETGIDHAVDHIHPLAGENLCGLHVPWNLQILTKSENSIKKNYFNPLPYSDD